MPGRICLFVRCGRDFTLSFWVGGPKSAMSVAQQSPHLWPPEFFDHNLRGDESYAEK
jgi:hypothetical protein